MEPQLIAVRGSECNLYTGADSVIFHDRGRMQKHQQQQQQRSTRNNSPSYEKAPCSRSPGTVLDYTRRGRDHRGPTRAAVSDHHRFGRDS